MKTVRPAGQVSFNNQGRVIIVTGGCSGIGRAVCDEFVESGATVVCADIDDRTASTLAAEIAFRKTDVASEDDCRETVRWTVQQYGAVDVLVNNAAIQTAESYLPVDQLPAEMLGRMVQVNFFGYTFMAKHVLAFMKQQRSGVVVNMASGQGHRVTRGSPVYGPIKAANILQAKQWGVEYARDGIRVVSVSPGAINTPLVRSTLEAQGGEAELANRHPVGRLGEPREVARAVMWLASTDASFITATDVSVDGGLDAFGAFADPFQPDDLPEILSDKQPGKK